MWRIPLARQSLSEAGLLVVGFACACKLCTSRSEEGESMTHGDLCTAHHLKSVSHHLCKRLRHDALTPQLRMQLVEHVADQAGRCGLIEGRKGVYLFRSGEELGGGGGGAV